jgi:hypothetical protein
MSTGFNRKEVQTKAEHVEDENDSETGQKT